MKSRLLTILIMTVLLLFFAVPLSFMLYGAASAISGMALIVGLIVLQYPAFAIGKSLGLIPNAKREADRSAIERHSFERSRDS